MLKDRTRSFVMAFAAFAALISTASCGPQPPAPLWVAKVDSKVAEKIRQSIHNGRLPSPLEVASSDIPVTLNPCDQFRAKLPADWFQDWIEVAEDPASPEGRKIRVFYYGKLKPGLTPSIFFNGGPAGSSHGSFRLYHSSNDYFTSLPSYPDTIENTSFVFIDQRGTGCSDFYPQPEAGSPNTPSSATQAYLERLSHYGSQGIVADAEQIRAKIWAGRKWIAVGQSYGAHIVHRYVVSAPDGLKAAFAHGNAITPDMNLRYMNRALSQARVVEAYFSRFSADRALLKQLVDYLTPQRCFETAEKTDPLCGYETIETFADMIGFTDNWLSIHQWIGAMVGPLGVQPQAIARFVAVNGTDKPDPRGSSYEAEDVISWVDRGVTSRDFDSCEEAKKALLSQGIDLSEIPMTECSGHFRWIATHPAPSVPVPSSSQTGLPLFMQEDPMRALLRSSIKQDLLTLDGLRNSLQANANLPLYVYSGHLDPWVPVENFAPEIKAINDLKNFHYTEFPDSGHDGFYTETWFWMDLIRESREYPEHSWNQTAASGALASSQARAKSLSETPATSTHGDARTVAKAGI